MAAMFHLFPSSHISPRFVDHSSDLVFARATYARELGAAVTALGNSAALLDVQQAQVTTGSLDDSGPVGPGVVAVRGPESVYCFHGGGSTNRGEK